MISHFLSLRKISLIDFYFTLHECEIRSNFLFLKLRSGVTLVDFFKKKTLFNLLVPSLSLGTRSFVLTTVIALACR